VIEIQQTPRRARGLVAALLLSLWCATSGVVAQQNTTAQTGPAVNAPPAASQAPQPTNPSTGRTSAQPAQTIATEQAIYLVRSALLTLNDANRSGNYTVLRDLAAPDFQARNSAADLAQVFSDLRRRNFDLFGAALLSPQFTTPPAVDANGRAHLAGFFPTRPLQIKFDLTFQSVEGHWRLFSISVATPPNPEQRSQFTFPAARKSPGLFYGANARSGTLGVRW
jgi:hypothetical protein